MTNDTFEVINDKMGGGSGRLEQKMVWRGQEGGEMTRYGREGRTSVTFCGRETNSGRWAGGVQDGESGVVQYGGRRE